MLDVILPQRLDNTYQGSRIALWLFALVVALRITQSLNVIFNGYSIAMNADGIPLNTFTPAAAQAVLEWFVMSAVTRLIVSLLCVLALVRYRAAIPFMFVVLIVSYLAGQLVLWLLPIAHAGTPPGPIINFVAFVVMIVGLALSLWRKGARG
jgi:hypothetical protein